MERWQLRDDSYFEYKARPYAARKLCISDASVWGEHHPLSSPITAAGCSLTSTLKCLSAKQTPPRSRLQPCGRGFKFRLHHRNFPNELFRDIGLSRRPAPPIRMAGLGSKVDWVVLRSSGQTRSENAGVPPFATNRRSHLSLKPARCIRPLGASCTLTYALKGIGISATRALFYS